MAERNPSLALYQRDFESLERHASADGQAWLRPLRQEAMQRFLQLGWPTLKDEEWRFTSIKPIAATPLVLAENGAAEISAQTLAPWSFPEVEVQLVFIDGHHRPELSRLEAASTGGLVVTSLAEAIRHRSERLAPHLAHYAEFRDDAFAALNTAFLQDGALIDVGRGVTLGSPIHLLFIATAAARPRISHPRNLILAGEASRATVIEHYVTLGEGVSFSNAVTEVLVGAQAQVAHYLLEEENTQAFNVSTLRVDQHKESRFESHSALFGGALVRNNVHVELQGPGCRSLVNGLFVAAGTQHMDNHMRVVHAQPHGESRQFYKGILDGRAHGVFTGRILVKPGAQKTDAKQTNRNLLLSDEAQINTQPQLEIYADDVKCTHGATTGRLDEEAAFYLQTRGIDAESARGLLIHAFARESLDRMSVEPVRARLEGLLAARLPRAASAEEPAAIEQAHQGVAS